MSKPDDISQDVWDEAEQHFDDFLQYEQGTYRPAVQIIARAILSERTKAAEMEKALREIAAHEPSEGNHNMNDLIAHAAVRRAYQAIRKGVKK